MQAMLQRMQAARGGAGGGAPDQPLPDTAEKIQISSLSLLKMLKHGRAGVPMEVMGLMLGQFVDDYTITCVDVFAMPQVSFRFFSMSLPPLKFTQEKTQIANQESHSLFFSLSQIISTVLVCLWKL